MQGDNTFSLISSLHNKMEKMLIDELQKKGITGIVPSHGSILVTLMHAQQLTMKELATRIGKSPQTVTTLVRKLESLGYVQTNRSKDDLRSIVVSLTAMGQQLDNYILEVSEKLYLTQYMGMNKEEILSFRRLLKMMLKNFTNN